MELTLEEETLIATFRKLSDAGKLELQRIATHELKREREAAESGETANTCKCSLKQPEERPETAAEPIFTE